MARLLAFLAAAVALAAPPRAMRLDYFHTGNAVEERFALDGVTVEGPWPGAPGREIDDTNLGKYCFEVVDRKTNRVLYSRGFARIYGEWETTGEAKQAHRTFHESVRFPEPAAAVQVTVKKRDRDNAFREIWSVLVDPKDPAMDRTPPPDLNVWAVMKNGEPSEKVDLLLLGDGYTAAEMDKWRKDARRLTETLFAVSPFRERRRDFNVWAIDTPAGQSGVSRPSDGVWRRSPLRAAYDALGSERYVLTLDNKRLREIASAAPYDFIEIVVNGRKYGGGGIHNLYATVAADNAWTPYIFVHELGHHFAGLADEYYTSEVAYSPAAGRPEPWEPNVTADPQAARWRDLIRPDTKLPTPWPKEAFETRQREIQSRRRAIRALGRPEEEMEALFAEESAQTAPLLAAPPHGRVVGAFEGAMYEARGYYRAQSDCIMFTRNPVGFCAVCRRAIGRVIALYAPAR
ncbi:MAG: IgA Peptidase M64 [Bryobacterales bacterium]|nr:IgA Peptidase M64 [Bryobacterales bacterium]